MKKHYLLLTLVLFGLVSLGQNTNKKTLISSVVVDTKFVDTFTFNLKWDYPWYIAPLDNGGFDNALGDTITKDDTVHLYHTANAKTNHQGEHEVRYCNSKMENDTMLINFLPELPGYASWLTIKINDSKFWCNFKAAYPRYIKGESLTWTIKKQSLVLNQSHYKTDDTIKGYFEIEFIESSSINNGSPKERNFYFKGYFKTPLKSND